MNLLDSSKGRYVLFTILYLSEGAPIGFIWLALPTLLRARGIPVDSITGLTAMLVLPWTLKFLWAPLVDSLRSARFGYRGWIMAAQAVMGLCLLPLTVLDPVESLGVWTVLLLAHALAASTQDVAIDAMAIRCVPRHEHGRINSCMQGGMLLGRGVFGGGTLWAIQWAGEAAVLITLTACIWTALLLLGFVREPGECPDRSMKEQFTQFGVRMRLAFGKRTTWLGLAFALTAAAAFEATGVLAGPYLMDREVAQETIGKFFAVTAVLAPLFGVLVGGPVSDRIGRTRAVGIFLAGFVAMILGLAGTDWWMDPAPPMWMLAWLAGLYVFIGLFTAASYALFMDLTDPQLGGTQFSTFMAATNGCESWSAKVGGLWAAKFGYPGALGLMSLVSLAALPLLAGLSVRGAKTAGADASPDPSDPPPKSAVDNG
jgi:MFS family permease